MKRGDQGYSSLLAFESAVGSDSAKITCRHSISNLGVADGAQQPMQAALALFRILVQAAALGLG